MIMNRSMRQRASIRRAPASIRQRIAAVLQGGFMTIMRPMGRPPRRSEERTRPAHNRELTARIISSLPIICAPRAFLLPMACYRPNEGRGYVLRRIMRRAMRHAHLLGAAEPSTIVWCGAETLKWASWASRTCACPAADRGNAEAGRNALRQMLVNGLRLLDDATSKSEPGATLPGDVAFKLYDTFGFPYDLRPKIAGQRRAVDAQHRHGRGARAARAAGPAAVPRHPTTAAGSISR